ncbi:hypothetical protein [Haloquadratum walsbyi]|uniref:hypothetical protein n=1 Tax=Haloquadratum walsbyi TaxID=293091 RepID=UPI001AD92902|nr:hypothetical protein [Haloquadratum walsbyi]
MGTVRHHAVSSKLTLEHAEVTSPEIADFWCANESPSDSSTPVEAGTAVDTSVSAKHVVKSGSPAFNRKPSGKR